MKILSLVAATHNVAVFSYLPSMKPQPNDILSASYLQQLCVDNNIDPQLVDKSLQGKINPRRIRGAITLDHFRAQPDGWTWNQILDMYANALEGGATWAEVNESSTYYYGITIWALIALFALSIS